MKSLNSLRSELKQSRDQQLAADNSLLAQYEQELRQAVIAAITATGVVAAAPEGEAVVVKLDDGSQARVALDVLDVEEPAVAEQF